MGDNESERVSDIDDDEIDEYLLSEGERHRKAKIWELINKEYEEKQRLRKEYEANVQNCSEDSAALLMEVNNANAKKRKELQQKRAADKRNAASAQNATRKKLSSRINYDALSAVCDNTKEPEIPENSKKQCIESVSNDANKETEFESDIQDDSYDIGQEDEYRQDYYKDEEYYDEGYNGGEYNYADDDLW